MYSMVDLRDDDGKRYGDWQKKDLRKDANEIHRSPDEKPWYMQNFWVIVLLLVFWPVGLYLMWKNDWSRNVKVVVTIAVLAFTAGWMYIYTQIIVPAMP